MILTEEYLNSVKSSIFIGQWSMGIDRKHRKGAIARRDGKIALSTVFPEICKTTIYYNDRKR